MENGALEIIEALYQMIAEAWGVPLGNEKCIIEREKVLNMLDALKARLPGEISEARRLVSKRDEFISGAKREADALRRQAEEQARRLIDSQEIVRAARQQADDMLASAESRTRELKRAASEYVDDALRRSEEAMNAALDGVRQARASFRAVAPAPEKPAAADEAAPSDGTSPDFDIPLQ